MAEPLGYCLPCFHGIRFLTVSLVRSLREAVASGPPRTLPEQTAGAKAARKAIWDKARDAVKDIIRAWLQKHPGEEVPAEIFLRCQAAVRDIVPMYGSDPEQVQTDPAAFVHHAHRDLLQTEGPPQKTRSEEEWHALFPRYPVLSDGYVQCYESSDVDGIRQTLKRYGLCVVRVLSASECEEAVAGMFEEINALRTQKGIVGPSVDPNDSTTWYNGNWPSKSKFLIDTVALHRQAFANRCSQKVYNVFVTIFGERRLHVSVDRWGVARGAKDNPRWKIGLKPHWDLNPWQCVRDFEGGIDSGYQGLIALTDQNLETGCHLTLPGCTHFLKQWCAERKLDQIANSRKSFHAAEDDPLLTYMQPIPLRRGEILIWSYGQLHGSTRSNSHDMRLVQYVRMYPAPEATWRANYEERDTFGCVRVLRRCTKRGDLKQSDIENLRLDSLGRRLLGLERWDTEDSSVAHACDAAGNRADEHDSA